MNEETNQLSEPPPCLVNSQISFIGISKEIEKVRQLIAKVGPQSTSVLIVGETGTGKEVVARAIHAASRVPGPFVKIDCSSMASTLMLAEIFGHTKGAFTGATTSRKGLIEAANNGTLFFDEIGELPIEQQPHLLTAIQDRSVRPLGSNQWYPFTSRILAATNVNLRQAVKENRFREDLFYRIKVLTIHVPPLRNRIDDIPVLIDHFLKRHALGRNLSTDVMRRLLTYTWPGNIRELENCIQSSCAVASQSCVGLADLPSQFHNSTSVPPAVGPPPVPNARSVQKQSSSLETMIDAEILRTIQESSNMVEAAARLGIGRTTLYRKMRKLGYGQKKANAKGAGSQ